MPVDIKVHVVTSSISRYIRWLNLSEMCVFITRMSVGKYLLVFRKNNILICSVDHACM